MLLSAGIAHAESRYQLQAGFTGGSGFFVPAFVGVSPTVAVGVESGDSVWLLGLGVQAAYSHRLIAFTVNGQQSFVYGDDTTVGASIAPGYRRYLSGFETGFAPLVEGSLEISAAHTSLENISGFTLGLAGTAGFGGEARFGDHFAINARLFARLGGSHQSSGAPSTYSLTFGVGTAAGVLLRF